jgi:hypothetical protein
MTPQDFCYWLQGLLEVGQPKALNETQVQQIAEHLALVFKKVTPSARETSTAPPSAPAWWDVDYPWQITSDTAGAHIITSGIITYC